MFFLDNAAVPLLMDDNVVPLYSMMLHSSTNTRNHHDIYNTIQNYRPCFLPLVSSAYTVLLYYTVSNSVLILARSICMALRVPVGTYKLGVY